MPFINVNGQLTFVSQAEFDDWNKAPASATAGIPAGGNIVQLNNSQEILTPNTASTSPNQILPIRSERIINDPGGIFAAEDRAIAEQAALVQAEAALVEQAAQGDADAFAGLGTVRDPNGVLAAEDRAIAEQAAAQAAAQGDVEAFDQLSAQRQAAQEQAAQQAATLDRARAQNTIANQRKNVNNADWRVKLRLAPQADYLYAAPNPGILQPLKDQGGVIFPYTPAISTGYKANYSSYDLTHSNYKGYYYQNSAVDAVTLTCPFTAQSTVEADYLLAVIHFFKSVTKMFYGQDAQRGTPPPLVYLTGLGEYQFNEHPCVVQSFTYTLPTDVDYVRARSPNINNSNMLNQRQSKNGSTVGTTWGGGILGPLFGGAINRLANAGLPKGGRTTQPAPATLGLNSPTYVPTKIEIAITLLPVQSRQQQSQDFSLRQYANGDLLKGGFW